MPLFFATFFILFGYSVSEDLSSLDPKVQSFLKAYRSEQIVQNNLLNHYYQSPLPSKVAIVFLPGMGEPALKYFELSNDIHTQATLYFWDHIGQGESSHLLPDEYQKVHIDSFDTYIRTFTHFLSSIRKSHSKIIIIGHSMGGHVALRTLLKRPDLGEGLILSAPLIEMNSKWIPIKILSWLTYFLPSTYYPPFYSFFKKASKKAYVTTSSQERLAVYKKTFTLFPKIKRNGATLGWLASAQDSISQLKSSDLSPIHIPILLLQAEHDYLVSSSAQLKLCQQIKTCQIKVVTHSKHELLFETDTIRSQALIWINTFIDNEIKQ